MNRKIWTCTNRKATAFDAADQFARELCEGRTVGEWNGSRFQLEDGVGWYETKLSRDGWEIWSTEP